MHVAVLLCLPCALAIQQPRASSITAAARLRGGARSNKKHVSSTVGLSLTAATLRGGAQSSSDGIKSLQYLKKRESSSRGLAVFIPLYVQIAKSWASTAGQPYRNALETILALELEADPTADADTLFNSLEELTAGGG
eukprot:17387-Heterococcus_DN1.PRE.3